MSTLKIREYTQLGSTANGAAPITQESGGVIDQTPVTFTSSSVQSAAFNTNTKYITAKADVAWCFRVAKDPTATVNMIAVPAGELYSMGVEGGHKIAVIAES